jgi:PilZ domain
MPLADRRLASRFEVVGTQLGILDVLEPLRVRNLSLDGVLLEYPNPLAVGSIYEFQLIDGTTSARVRAAVRHVSPLRQSSAGRYFLVGLEFLNLDTRSSVVIERLLNKQPAGPAPEEV